MGILPRLGSKKTVRVRDTWASFSIRIPRPLHLALKAQVLAESQRNGDKPVFLQEILPDIIQRGLKARQKDLAGG